MVMVPLTSEREILTNEREREREKRERERRKTIFGNSSY